uniref:Pentacotripeptide-repeat region of PRORP domain-containing protein n=1 Tax=Glycine max TaxID=3847 RepID=K7LEK5_SOYBN
MVMIRINNSLYFFSPSIQNVDDAVSQFNRMLCMRHTPPIIEFNKILDSFAKMKQYPLSHRLELKGIVPSLVTLIILINCFCHMGQITFDFFIQLNQVSYKTLINGVCKIGDTRAAIQLLRKIYGRLTKPNELMFNDIIDAMCKDQLVNEAYGLFSEMAVKGATVLKEATGLLNEMVSKTINPNVYTLHAWELMLFTLMDEYVLVYEVKKAKYVFNAMSLVGVTPNVQSSQISYVWDLIDEMHDRGQLANVITYISLEKRLKNAQEVFQNLLVHGYHLNVYTYNIMINGHCKQGLLEEALTMR